MSSSAHQSPPNLADFNLVFVAIYIVLCPFYFLPSGLPQLADAFGALSILCFLGLVLTTGGGITIPLPAARPLRFACFFLVWVGIVTIANALLGADATIFLAILFYLYNVTFLLSFAVSLCYATNLQSKLSLLYAAVVVSILLQTTLGLLMRGQGLRATIFFNNPNQLGNYAASMVTVFFSLNHIGIKYFDKTRNELFELAIGGATFFLALLSLSKAALFGFSLVFLVQFARNKLAWLLLIPALYFCFDRISNSQTISRAKDRVASVQSDDTLAARGYDRIWRFPEYLAFGAGEGDFYRFRKSASHFVREIHSSFGTLLFSYGIVGVGLFGYMLYLIYSRNDWILLVYLSPIAVYSIAHNNLRSTVFWLALALAILCKVIKQAQVSAGSEC